MASNDFFEGVRPGGLTSGTEIRILICYLLDSSHSPVSRQQLEDVLLGEELVNYFAMAESLAQVKKQGLITGTDSGYTITEAGQTVGRTLAHDVPKTVRDTAVRGLIRAQQWATKESSHQSEIVRTTAGRLVRCKIDDNGEPLFQMELYMPDDLSAEAVKSSFIDKGDEVYKLVLAALTGNRQLATKALDALGGPEENK